MTFKSAVAIAVNYQLCCLGLLFSWRPFPSLRVTLQVLVAAAPCRGSRPEVSKERAKGAHQPLFREVNHFIMSQVLTCVPHVLFSAFPNLRAPEVGADSVPAALWPCPRIGCLERRLGVDAASRAAGCCHSVLVCFLCLCALRPRAESGAKTDKRVWNRGLAGCVAISCASPAYTETPRVRLTCGSPALWGGGPQWVKGEKIMQPVDQPNTGVLRGIHDAQGGGRLPR